MMRTTMRPKRIDRQLVGPEITVGGHAVQTTLQLTGWSAGVTEMAGGWGGALIRLTPIEAVVRGANGSEHRVTMSNPTGQSLRGIGLVAAAVAVCCSVLMLIARLTQPRG